MNPRICLIGQVVVDVLHINKEIVVRLGGIFHAARALSALGCEFEIAYVAPKYLDAEIALYAHQIGAKQVFKIGEVDGCPNVVLVGEPTEAGSQDYEFILEKQQRCDLELESFKDQLYIKPYTDVIIFPGGFPLKNVLLELKSTTTRVHVDANFEPISFNSFGVLKRSLQTLILSTSSDTFLKTFKGNAKSISAAGLKIAESFVLKENRGGSRYFQRGKMSPTAVPAFPRKIIHSVGVGDCYNSVFVFLSRRHAPKVSLTYASFIAGEYASTLNDKLFRSETKRALKIPTNELTKLKGISLPWESRRKIQIYIAAPDFSSVDASQIDRAVACLEYHNFLPRRPVKENGEITRKSAPKKRFEAAAADIQLLEDCQLLLAVPIFDDPGTYIEIGIALKKGIPVIIFAPNRITENLLTEELPTLVSSDMDEIISEIFIQAAKFYGQ